ncbi:sporulation protein SsgA [Novosphingobium sp. TH158]|nr:sporulation protein SsgA [Novosphingobium sp. TH158]
MLTTMLAACGGNGADSGTLASASQALTTGPAADYPMVLGDPFVVDGVTYTPQDRLNFDQVGYAGVDVGGDQGITIAHRTLPLPSYAEVTSLDSGRTILVRVTRRGPMAGSQIVELSPGAANQLGVTAERAPIRIRRVNPPEPERAALREGRAAPLRIDTPKSLVAVLRRKLEPGSAPALLPMPKANEAVAAAAAPVPAAEKPAVVKVPVVKAPVAPVAKAPEKPVPAGSLIVQVGAFSSAEKAGTIAKALGARVSSAASLHRVRLGPFATRGQAEAALAKAKAAGYSEARIQRAN